MARRPAPKASLQAQLVAVRRAASAAALACKPRQERPNIALRSKQETLRDAQTAAAMTLAAVQASREALDMLPDVQRDQLAIRLAAAGFRAVRVEAETPMPIPMQEGAAHV